MEWISATCRPVTHSTIRPFISPNPTDIDCKPPTYQTFTMTVREEKNIILLFIMIFIDDDILSLLTHSLEMTDDAYPQVTLFRSFHCYIPFPHFRHSICPLPKFLFPR